MSTNYLMGDYSFGISSSVAALSPVEYKQNSTNKSFFDTVAHNMKDDLLLDKSNSSVSGKQTESQQPSTNGETVVSNGEGGLEHFSPNKVKPNDETELNLNTSLDKQLSGGETTSSGTSTSGLHLEFSDASMSNASITTSAPSFWSGDDNFSPGVSPLKNTLSFQNFPNTSSVNPVFNSNLNAQISVPQSLPPQRRAITGAHNFNQTRHQQPQSNLLKTFSNWSNPQSTSWSAPQTPNGVFPWNVNLANQKRSVPNINPVYAQKKPPQAIGQHSMVISPSKFRRSTSLPLGKQFTHTFGGNPAFDMTTLDENRDGNMIFPFQDQIAGNVSSNPLDTLRFPLEQQLGLLDIMRNTNADNQEQVVYKDFLCFLTKA